MTNDELERLARAATPGPWTYADNAPVSYGSAWVNAADVKNLAVCDGTRRSETHGFCLKMDEDENERNAAFIAAANPATILALLSERAELLATVERMRGDLGDWAERIDAQAWRIGTSSLNAVISEMRRAVLTTGEEK